MKLSLFKKSVLLVLILCFNIFAEEKGILDKDTFYQEAIKMEKRNRLSEYKFLGMRLNKKRMLYERLYRLYISSVKIYNNPYSAEKAYLLIFYNLVSKKEYSKDIPALAELMYKNGRCLGYFAKANLLSEDKYHTKNLKKALKLYRKAAFVCKKEGKGWLSHFISKKHYSLKLRLAKK